MSECRSALLASSFADGNSGNLPSGNDKNERTSGDLSSPRVLTMSRSRGGRASPSLVILSISDSTHSATKKDNRYIIIELLTTDKCD